MTRIEKYLRHVESVCGGEGELTTITDPGEKPPVTVVAYPGIPEDGCVTAFSYGLSTMPHREWIASRPELVISVGSTDDSWALAMGELIRERRKTSLFTYGTIYDFGAQISEESPMSFFLVFACIVLEQEDLRIELPQAAVHLSQLYPIHEEEVAVIQALGPERFVLQSKIDFFDVQREPFVLSS